MLGSRTYLDHNATTPIHPDVRAAMIEALDCVGNPSSIHSEGRAARAMVDSARRDVAALTGCVPDDVIFTSGGSEALNMLLTPELASSDGPIEVLLIGAGEHAAVTGGHRFPPDRTETIATTADGALDLNALKQALDRHAGRRVMLALQAANNETGVIQPVAEAADLVHARGGFVLCDAVQAAGKIDCRINQFDADAIAISAHKFGGPKGVGALIFSSPTYHVKQGLVRGGGQERGLRSGTENLSGIVALGTAARLAAARWPLQTKAHSAWRDSIETIVLSHAPDAVIFGRATARLPNTLSFAVPRVDAQVLLMNLDLNGVAVSTGSACSSGKIKPSPVLRAMGVPPDLARSALRVSLGWTTRDDDIAAFEAAFTKAVRTMRPQAARAAA